MRGEEEDHLFPKPVVEAAENVFLIYFFKKYFYLIS